MRSSSRRSGPVVSKRLKVSEHPLIGPPPGPPGPSVIGGLSTVEVRWILSGQLDAAVVGWFGRFPAGLDSREDAYLVHPVLRGLSVKIRAGQLLEVKQYHGSPGILDAAGRARGRIECWKKWSFPFGPLGPDDAGPRRLDHDLEGLSGLVNRVFGWADRLQRKHGVLGFPYAVVYKRRRMRAGGRRRSSPTTDS